MEARGFSRFANITERDMATIKGTKRDDRLAGTAEADVIVGFDGDDRLRGGDGDDVLKPGPGADTVLGGHGDDVIRITDLTEATPDRIVGGAGRDTLDLSTLPPINYPTDWLYSAATDSFTISRLFQPASITASGFEVVIGTGEGDTIDFSAMARGVTVDGRAEWDRIYGGGGNDVIRGGTGNDTLGGGDGRNQVYGDAGDDLFYVGGTGLIDGGAGTDTVTALADVDLARGWVETQAGGRVRVTAVENIDASFLDAPGTARGDDRANVIDAGNARYGGTLAGGGGNDRITGSELDDRLIGGEGRDTLAGGLGADTLIGGAAADIFAFVPSFVGPPDGIDTIADFSRREGDRIDVSQVDADTDGDDLDAFTFIGTRAFSDRAGQLRYEIRGGDALVQADTDGDGRADLQFVVANQRELRASDFILVLPDDAAPLHAPAIDGSV